MLRADGIKYTVIVDGYEFEEDGIRVVWTENIRHDSPDKGRTKLTVEEMEMSDEDWNDYILSKLSKTEAEKVRRKQAREIKEREKEVEEYIRLKEKYGN